MAPRSTTLPTAQTESARELARKFFCEMCGKGYARINEFEAHENSYDHQHRKRLKEMKALTRNPTAAVRDTRAEKKRRENSEMMSVNLQAGEGGGQRPSNKTGFRDATQVKVSSAAAGAGAGAGAGIGGVGSEAGRGFGGEGRGDERDKEKGDKGEQEKVLRPPMWDELDRFYSLVDASALPPQMQDHETPLPWGQIWNDKDEMDRFQDAVQKEMESLEDGKAVSELKRAWDEMSDDGEFDDSD